MMCLRRDDDCREKVFFITSFDGKWNEEPEESEYEFILTKLDIHASSYKLSIRKAKTNYSFSLVCNLKQKFTHKNFCNEYRKMKT